ncbi:MAG: ABC transporter permease [Nakamurella sp.]
MNTVTIDAAPSAAGAPGSAGAPAATRRPTALESNLAVTFPRVMRSEWIKLRTVRSIVITLLASMVVVIGIGILATSIKSGDIATPRGRPAGGPPGFGSDPTAVSLAGVQLAQMIVAIVGVILVTSEYVTGSIRATLAAVPRRLPVLFAKVTVFAVTVFVIEIVAVLVAFLAGQAILGNVGVSLGDAGVLAAVIGAALTITGMGLIGVAFGFLFRSTAGGIAVTIAVFFIVPVLINIFSTSVKNAVNPYLPSSAAASLANVTPLPHYLTYWPALLLMIGWVVVFVVAAAIRMMRSDAN